MQAYNHEIADWALEHQRFGGPSFNATRMIWIKPSFVTFHLSIISARYVYDVDSEMIFVRHGCCIDLGMVTSTTSSAY